jgi:hypothetical protein
MLETRCASADGFTVRYDRQGEATEAIRGALTAGGRQQLDERLPRAVTGRGMSRPGATWPTAAQLRERATCEPTVGHRPECQKAFPRGPEPAALRVSVPSPAVNRFTHAGSAARIWAGWRPAARRGRCGGPRTYRGQGVRRARRNRSLVAAGLPAGAKVAEIAPAVKSGLPTHLLVRLVPTERLS